MPDELPETLRLIEALEDELAAEGSPEPLPELPPPPPGRAGRARRALALLGGVASGRAVAAMVAADGGPHLTVRQVREALRSRDIAVLGGGYLALPDAVERPLLPWLRAHLLRHGPRSVDDVVAAVQARWPHGDPAAISAWLRQDPAGIVVVDGVVRAPPRR